jgi:hypothetical protein
MRLIVLLAVTAALAGCSAEQSQQSGESVTTSDVAAPAESASARDSAAPDPVKVTLPQLAYSYSLGFLIPGDRMAATQDAHRDLCENMGQARCQLLQMERADSDGQSDGATLKLRVATREAKMLTDAMTKAATDAGGRAEATKVGAEDVSKQISDVKARIAQRELLVRRLTDVLRTRNGKVAELVEAERSVAQGQEELDQARAWLNELGGRVAMSDVEVRYTAIAPAADARTLGSQLGEATIGSAATFVIGLKALLTILIYLLPWALVIVPTVLLLRRRRPASPQG